MHLGLHIQLCLRRICAMHNLGWSDSDYLLELPDLELGLGDTGLFVDAHLSCLRGDSPPDQVTLYNHQCEDPPCAGRWFYHKYSVLPIFVAYSRSTLRGGTELTYNYDAHLRSDAFTMDFATALACGRTDCPCRCAGSGPCPNNRFFP